jgi:hypothetical protein
MDYFLLLEIQKPKTARSTGSVSRPKRGYQRVGWIGLFWMPVPQQEAVGLQIADYGFYGDPFLKSINICQEN